MKTLIVAAALALSSITSIANNSSSLKKVNVNVTRAFEDEFGKVQEIQWTSAANKLIRANFTKDGEQFSAFFNESGEYVATTIARTTEELPDKLKAALHAKEKDCIIFEALEYQDSLDSAYFLRVYANGVEKLYRGTNLGGLEKVNL